jgi:integrase
VDSDTSGDLVPIEDEDDARTLALAVLADDEIRGARRLADKARADSTRKAYAEDQEAFARWCRERDLSPFPADPGSVVRWLSSVADDLAVSTIRRRLSGISMTHKLAGYPSPTAHGAVAEVMAGIIRSKGIAPRRVAAVRTSILRQLVEPLQPDRLADVRDRALLVCGMAGAFRRSELCAVDVEHVSEDDEGLRVWVPRSKRDQQGKGALLGLPYGSRPGTCPVRSYRAWLAASGITSGPVFRAVDRHGNVSPTRLTPRQVPRIVKRRALAIGLPPADYSGHSLRAGYATEAYAQGRPELSIMRGGRWTRRSSMDPYVRDGGVWADNAAMSLGL